MSKKGYVTNGELHRELGEIQNELKHLRQDMVEIRTLYARVKSLELFKSYVKGISAAIMLVISTTITVWKLF